MHVLASPQASIALQLKHISRQFPQPTQRKGFANMARAIQRIQESVGIKKTVDDLQVSKGQQTLSCLPGFRDILRYKWVYCCLGSVLQRAYGLQHRDERIKACSCLANLADIGLSAASERLTQVDRQVNGLIRRASAYISALASPQPAVRGLVTFLGAQAESGTDESRKHYSTFVAAHEEVRASMHLSCEAVKPASSRSHSCLSEMGFVWMHADRRGFAQAAQRRV